MPSRDGGKAHDVAEQIGAENWATLEELIREVAKRVGPRVMEWRVVWGVEPLIGLIVLHTAIITARDMRLGELVEELKAAQSGEWAWGVRVDGPRGSRVSPAADEHDARRYAAGPAEDGRTYTVVRRRIGPWIEAPDA